MGKRQEVRYWLGKLKVMQGELDHSAFVLLATRSMDGAFAALNDAARTFYGSEDDPLRSDERYESHNGAVIVSPMSVRQIPGQSFRSMRAEIMVRMAEGVTAAEIEADKVPDGALAIGLLEAVEKYVACVSAARAGRVSKAGRQEALLARCSAQAVEIRESLG